MRTRNAIKAGNFGYSKFQQRVAVQYVHGIASNPGPLSRARAKTEENWKKRRKSERAWDSSKNLGNVV